MDKLTIDREGVREAIARIAGCQVGSQRTARIVDYILALSSPAVPSVAVHQAPDVREAIAGIIENTEVSEGASGVQLRDFLAAAFRDDRVPMPTLEAALFTPTQALDAAVPSDDGLRGLTRPIIGIENRTAQEAFDIMADRIRSAARGRTLDANAVRSAPETLIATGEEPVPSDPDKAMGWRAIGSRQWHR